VTAAPIHADADWGRLRSHVRGMLGGRLSSGADADDVAQEVLLKVFRSSGNLRDGDRFGSWLAATVRNAVADRLRERQRHPVVPDRDRDRDQPGDTAAPTEGTEEAARTGLIAALRPFAERLPAIYREVIILSELDGVPHAEIARRLSISVSGVKSRVQRGREHLHRMLTDCCEISLDARNAVVECVPKQPDAPADCCSPGKLSSFPRG
jgi:RNA polymerase sigma-70 factor, ECF subfamily